MSNYERRPDMDGYQHLWSKARIAHDAIMDSVTAEVTGKQSKLRRAGKLQATHDHDEFRAVATPRIIAQLCKDHDHIIRAYLRVRDLEDNRLPISLRRFLIMVFGAATYVAGAAVQKYFF